MRRIGTQGLEHRANELIKVAVELAQQARAEATGDRFVAIAGAITTLEWCFRPDLVPSFDALRAEHYEIIEPMKQAGVDLILFETFNNSGEARAALAAAAAAGLPAWVSFVCDSRGCLLSGETIPDMVAQIEPAGADAILFNCAPPDDVTLALQELARTSRRSMGAYPHIGRFDPPEWMFTDEYPPKKYAEVAREWLSMGVQIVGGCCGTTPDHISELKRSLPPHMRGYG
jgi:homocysteine S-methyltransferase